jgi:hypothetical protein
MKPRIIKFEREPGDWMGKKKNIFIVKIKIFVIYIVIFIGRKLEIF